MEIQQLLLELNSTEKTKQIRAAIELGKLGRSDGSEILLDLVREMNWEASNLYEVVEILGRLKEKRAVDILIPMTNRTAHIADTAAWALMQIGEPAGVDIVFERMRSPSPWRGWGAAQMVAELGDVIVERLVGALSDNDHLMKARAAYALSMVQGKSETIGIALRAALDDSEPYVRKQVAMALGRIGDKLAIEKLTFLLNDEDWEVRNNAAAALVMLGDRENTKIFEVFLKNLKSELEHVRILTSASLSWITSLIPDQDWIEPLANTLQTDPHRAVRIHAAKALANIHSEKVKAVLLQTQDDTDELVRNTITELLQKWG